MKLKLSFLVVGLLLLGLVLAGCGAAEEPCPECPDCPTVECPECPACPETEACPEPEACPECPEAECPEPAAEVPFEAEWAASPHADAEAEAFRHWDEDDPAEVSASCATCHSSTGYQAFVAGEEVPSVPVGEVVDCVACHNEATMAMNSVVMPSGLEITNLGDESRCMVCHQGRESTVSVNASIEEAGVEEDQVSEDLGFLNIHYYAAAATKYGTLAKGGYEYEGKSYDSNFAHVSDYDTCIECHNMHTLEVRLGDCQVCHTDVASVEDLKNVRMAGSLVDYDGDGNVEEGIYYELEGMQALLYEALQAYGSEVAGSGLTYDPSSYPYFFDEAGERYASWTPRLLKAAYNYQVSYKDPGDYAHGGKYIIELLYDSTESLNEALSSPVDLSNAHRIDHGHFAGSEEAFRHWDEDGAVSSSCATCHSAVGLPFLIEHGVQIEQPLSNGFNCETCHSDFLTFELYQREEVEFPSGAVVSASDPNANLCLTCHQGRSSSASVESAVAGIEPDAVSEDLGFINIHYFAAGATLFGSEVQGAYQYPDKEYVGRFAHVDPYSNCTQCHSAHTLEVQTDACSACHGAFEELTAIRMDATDYDGDGDTSEGIAGEIATMAEVAYAAMQAYAEGTDGVSPIVYDGSSYPYFFDDAGERYATWTPTLVKAAYNYQYVQKDPGAFAHNAKYIIEVLYDTIEDLGGDVGGMTRP
jgi:hypothetical protein